MAVGSANICCNCIVYFMLRIIGGDLLGSMADAIENAAVVLLVVSSKYKESQNCKGGRSLQDSISVLLGNWQCIVYRPAGLRVQCK